MTWKANITVTAVALVFSERLEIGNESAVTTGELMVGQLHTDESWLENLKIMWEEPHWPITVKVSETNAHPTYCLAAQPCFSAISLSPSFPIVIHLNRASTFTMHEPT